GLEALARDAGLAGEAQALVALVRAVQDRLAARPGTLEVAPLYLGPGETAAGELHLGTPGAAKHA
ncbi:hypothetical protein, partial [Salipiger mucosus]|uniref:hypothetical protein n=1 Tax=Salipiger mucosus TaxID=263378 RepID=UPI0005696007